MFEKLVSRQYLTKVVSVLLVMVVLFLTLNVLLTEKDGRRQIIDMDGGSEERLCAILSEIKGAGKVNAVIQYNESNKVTGVILTCEGAGDPVVVNNITNGVAALYDIPVSNIAVFEKEKED